MRPPYNFSYLFEARPLICIRCKQRFPTKNARALRFKKGAPFVGKKRRTILSPVEFQKQTPARLEESCPNIVEEKFPIGRRPFQPFTVFGAPNAMETNTVTGHEIEFLSKIRQRCLGMNPRDHASNIEELSCAAKERFIVGVESESFVAEEPAEIKKVTRATAKIENLERRRTIEPKILHALDVDADPVGCVFVGVDLSRVGSVGVLFAQPF